MREPEVEITAAEPLDDHWLRLTFADGAVHDVDLGPTLALGGVFAPIYTDRATFESVGVDSESRTIVWPGEIDLDPYVLRGVFETGDNVPLPRRIVTSATSM